MRNNQFSGFHHNLTSFHKKIRAARRKSSCGSGQYKTPPERWGREMSGEQILHILAFGAASPFFPGHAADSVGLARNLNHGFPSHFPYDGFSIAQKGRFVNQAAPTGRGRKTPLSGPGWELPETLVWWYNQPAFILFSARPQWGPGYQSR